MPIDDRLRRGIHDLASEVDPDVETRLDEVTSGSARTRSTRVTMLLAYGAVIVLAVVLTPIALRMFSEAPPAGSSPSAVPTSSATCPPRPPSVVMRGGTCAAALEPGAHRATWFTPPFDYVIPANSPVVWDNVQDLPGQFAHAAGTPGGDGMYLFRDVAARERQCTVVKDPTVGSSASALADWMEANDSLIVSRRVTESIGGLNGIALDLAVSGANAPVCPDTGDYPPGVPVVPLIQDGSRFVAWSIGGTERIRLYLLDLPGGGNVVVAVEAIDTDFAALLKLCEPVIRTIQFDSNYY